MFRTRKIHTCEVAGGEAIGRIDRTHSGRAVVYFPDGSSYAGGLRNGSFHGYGKYTMAPREAGLPAGFYDGRWVDGIAHGRGEFQHPDGWVFRGRFDRGRMEDRIGVVAFPDGLVYRGEVQNDRITGSGELFQQLYTDRLYEIRLYSGEWLDEQFHGVGSYYHPNGKKWYTGQWKHDRVDGIGALLDDEERVVCTGRFSEGEYTEPLPEGLERELLKRLSKRRILPLRRREQLLSTIVKAVSGTPSHRSRVAWADDPTLEKRRGPEKRRWWHRFTRRAPVSPVSLVSEKISWEVDDYRPAPTAPPPDELVKMAFGDPEPVS